MAYLTGINSISFREGFCHREGVFRKDLVGGMREQGRVYMTAGSWLLMLAGIGVLFWKKRAVRHALQLAERHGGEPLVVQCEPVQSRLRAAPQVKGGCYQEGAEIRVVRVFRLVWRISVLGLDVVCVLGGQKE